MQSDPSKPQDVLRDAVKCVIEGLKLHKLLGDNATEYAVKGALRWRYGISTYEADACYKASMELANMASRGQ